MKSPVTEWMSIKSAPYDRDIELGILARGKVQPFGLCMPTNCWRLDPRTEPPVAGRYSNALARLAVP